MLPAALITPARNASAHLQACIDSVIAQTTPLPFTWHVFDDGSTDDTRTLLEAARPALAARQVQLHVTGTPAGSPARGCGFGRNRAVEQAAPDALLIFLDADDVMAPERVAALLEAAALNSPRCLYGSRYSREGEGRPRELAWHNGLTPQQLVWQRLRDTTLAQPTWAVRRTWFDALGGYAEAAPNEGEDLLFFYKHLARGGELQRLEAALVMYRHTQGGVVASRGVPAARLFAIRLAELEQVLRQPPWCDGFTLWGLSREGKALFKGLSGRARACVRAFAEVDAAKIGRPVLCEASGRRVPVLHFRAAAPPLLLCVKPGLTGAGEGSFEANLASLGLQEGTDYLHFS